MEIQVKELIEQIKRDGVETAEAEAKAIVEAAQAQAEKIIAEAKAESDKILRDAKAETERMTKSGEDAISQAGRNLLISFRESVSRELRAVVGEAVSAVYASDALAQLIVHAIENWTAKPDAEDISVVLGAEDLKKLEETAVAALKERLMKGVTLKPAEGLDGGFRIAVSDGGAYYDYSAEAVAEMLSNYLSPKVAALLKEAN